LQAALAEPRSLRGVVVVAPAVWGHVWSEDWREHWGAMRDLARSGNIAAALQRYAGDAMFAGVREQAEMQALLQDMQAGCRAMQLLEGEPDEGTDTRARLSTCKVPVLVLSAARDRADFRDCAREIAAAVPGAEWHEFDASSHCPNLEVPATFNAQVLEFLSRHA
jgi:pimeloyl-ACP methyl ester carboxylesterase